MLDDQPRDHARFGERLLADIFDGLIASVGGFLSAPFFYLGFLWVPWDADKQAWHDKVFRTYVVSI